MIIFCIFFVGYFFCMDYSDLSWGKNFSSYIGFIVCILGVLNMVYSNRYEKRKSIKL